LKYCAPACFGRLPVTEALWVSEIQEVPTSCHPEDIVGAGPNRPQTGVGAEPPRDPSWTHYPQYRSILAFLLCHPSGHVSLSSLAGPQATAKVATRSHSPARQLGRTRNSEGHLG